jgi:hypothetical protein
MTKIRLSYSAVEKYKFCPALYRYHYIDKIRSEKVGSPLPFGSALDEAFGRIKLEKKKKLTKKEKELVKITPEQIFRNNFMTFNYNKKNMTLLYDLNVMYNKADIDLSLLEQADLDFLKEFDPEVTDYEVFLEECFTIKKNKEKLSEEDNKLYNAIAYRCLLKKGIMLINAYKRDIMPKIHEVFSIQKKISLKDDDCNEIVGYIDAIVSFIDSPKRKVILDDKTSSKAYKKDSVVNSPQLATYCEAEGIEYGAYAIAEKNIRKRDPRARTQLIIDKVSKQTIDKTFEEYDNALEGIKNEQFDKNYDSGCFNFGKTCDYYGYCRSNCKNTKGLVKLK